MTILRDTYFLTRPRLCLPLTTIAGLSIAVIIIFWLTISIDNHSLVQQTKQNMTSKNLGTLKNVNSASQLTSLVAIMGNPVTALYQGYSSVKNFGLSTAVEGSYTSMGSETVCSYTITDSIESLYSVFGTTITASFKLAFLLTTSITNKIEFVNSLIGIKRSINLVVYATNSISSNSSYNHRLKKEVQQPETEDDLKTFFSLYGDSFISKMVVGSEYFAVYTFYATSEEQYDQIKNEFSVGSVVPVISLDINLISKLDKFKSTVFTEVKQYVAGIANRTLPAESDIIKYALNFASIPVDKLVVLNFEYFGYERVFPKQSPIFSNYIIKNREYFVGIRGQVGLAEQMTKIQQLKNDIQNLRNIYRFYSNLSYEQLEQARLLVDSDINSVNNQINLFVSNPINNFTQLPLTSLSLGSPILQFQANDTTAQGYYRGIQFVDAGDIYTYLYQQTRISAIEIQSGSTWHWGIWDYNIGWVTSVLKLTTTYVNKNGRNRVETHGGGGSSTNFVNLVSGDFVKVMNVRSGIEILHLQILTAGGAKVSGGGEGGDPFDWTVPDGSVVVGFGGRVDNGRLFQIQVSFVTLKPPQWITNDKLLWKFVS